MSQITVKLKNGEVATYIKPKHCRISDEEWNHPFGYCWAFAVWQDNGEEPCKEWDEECCEAL